MCTSTITAFVPMADDDKSDDENGWTEARWIVSGGRAGRARRGSEVTA